MSVTHNLQHTHVPRSDKGMITCTSKKARIAYAFGIAFLLSFVTVLSFSMRDTGYLEHPLWLLALASLVSGTILGALFLFIDRCLIKKYAARQVSTSNTPLYSTRLSYIGTFISHIAPRSTRKSILAHTVIMFALWIPMFIALYPGSMNWDTYIQIMQVPDFIIPWGTEGSYLPDIFSDHHPIFDSIIFSAFARTSNMLFGTWNYGVFSFVLIQGIGTAAMLTYALAYLRRIGAPYLLCALAYIFFALFPFYPASAATMIKDSLFSWLFIPYFICLVEIIRTNGNCLKSNKFISVTIVLALLLALSKKPGLYIVIPTAIIMACVYRKHWKPLLAQALSVGLVMLVILPGIIFPLWGVSPGPSKEILTSFYQSTARYVEQYPHEVTPEERSAIDAVLSYDTLGERYNARFADTLKDTSNLDATNEEIQAYLSTWLAQTLRHPEVYLESTLATSARFYSPGDLLWLHEDTGGVELGGSERVWQPTSLDSFRETVLGIWHSLEEVPLLGKLYTSCALYVWWLPLFVLFVFIARARPWASLMIPWAISMFIVTVGPVYHPRYLLHIIYTVPLLICLVGMVYAKRLPKTQKPHA